MSLSVVALVVSGISLLVAGASLVWQVAAWRLSGGRGRAVLIHGHSGGGIAYTGPVKRDRKPHPVNSLTPPPARTVEVIGLKVYSTGRAPVVVERLAVGAKGSGLVVRPSTTLDGPPLPCRLEPGENAMWLVAADLGKQLVSTSHGLRGAKAGGVFMAAELGSGKTLRTRRLVNL